MPAPDFLDTNVLVYAYDATDTAKQEVARNLLRRALGGEAVISVQVLAEFAATLLHKLTPPANPRDVSAVLNALGPIKLVPTDGDLVSQAVKARERYGVHFYDGMILATAQRGRCQRILSEDLNAGQSYFGISVENPFDTK
jgi:predicted nucleic acid-binding protein